MPRARAIAPTRYTCTFRVRILGGFYAPPDARSVWRELELRADQTLEDLGEAIPPAFGFDDDHLWSFFLSGKPWDRKSEYARITSDDLLEGGHKRLASRLRVRDAPAGKEFLFLFDYGDEWHFGVKLARTGEIEPGGGYPRVVSSVGDAPPQYPDLEDDSDDDDEAYQQERERLLERYDAWAARQGISGDTSMMLAGLLDWKWEAEGRLTCWTADDLRELLLEWCPQALAIPDEELPRVVPGVRTLLRFLDETELLDPESDRLGALEATLDWAEPQFAEAMRDISRFSPAKAALSAMWAEGVDLDDSQAVDRFLSKFQLPAEIRLAGQGAVDTPRFPPVQTPPLDDLQTAAAAVPVVRQLCLLVEWVGEGRKLTAKGNLTVADGKDLAAHLGLADPAAIMAARIVSSRDLAGLDLALAWAKELRLVRVHKGRLVRVKQRQSLLDDPLELFNRAFDELPQLGAELLPRGMVESAFLGGLAEATIDLLAALYTAEEPVGIDELAAHVWEQHLLGRLDETDAGGPLVDVWRVTTAVEVAQLLAKLQDLGVVEHSRPDDGPRVEADAEPEAAPLDPEAEGLTEAVLSALGGVLLRLTPLGIWRTNILLRAAGADAPVIGVLAGNDVEALIDGVSDYDEAACRAELRVWCLERGAAAAGELAAYARATSTFERRMMVFTALEEAGTAAEAEVRAMLSDPTLRPYAQMWLVQNGFQDERSLDPGAATLLMAETLATILDVDGPAALVEHMEELGPPGEQIAMLESLWRASSPHIDGVLETIGKAHPTAKVAKAARKAAFKLRSRQQPNPR
jgi:Plasmid pRiA4b ORF-3-like protein